jgi:hypothetical protein
MYFLAHIENLLFIAYLFQSMTIKRIILILMTIATIWQISFSLIGSSNEPQIQGNLELYQNNLVLHITELQPEKLDLPVKSNDNFRQILNSLIGKEPYRESVKQYREAIRLAQVNGDKLQAQLDRLLVSDPVEVNNNIQQEAVKKSIIGNNNYLDELNLKLGILQTANNKIDKALQTWDKIPDNSNLTKTASLLQNLWQKLPSLPSDAETIINNNLTGWFRYRSLQKLDLIGNKQSELANLEIQEQNIAIKSLIQLTIIGLIPIISGLLGVALSIFLFVQLILKKEKSILATNANTSWETPWDWENIWQVIIVGFFFISQFILPIFFSLFGFNPAEFTLRQKATYVLISYLAMAASGLGVLYLSLKKYFPLPKNWFQFNLFENWFLWGFGGYLVALPLVVIVSLINQQIWHGQGGSNPLLFLALKSQDSVALAIFFFTASIAAPIFEEIIFRGFLLSSLSKYVSVTTAIILSSLLFAIAHLSLSEIVPLMTLGIVLGTVYSRSRNLLSSILLHGLWNSGTLISLFILGSGQ